MNINPKLVLDRIASLDTLAQAEKKFDEVRAKGGLAWAIENYGSDVQKAHAIARIVRPIVEAHAEKTEAEWLDMVRAIRGDQTRALVHGLWQNASNRWDAEAAMAFLSRLEYLMD